mgnify:CR=1 FL=1
MALNKHDTLMRDALSLCSHFLDDITLCVFDSVLDKIFQYGDEAVDDMSIALLHHNHTSSDVNEVNPVHFDKQHGHDVSNSYSKIVTKSIVANNLTLGTVVLLLKEWTTESEKDLYRSIDKIATLLSSVLHKELSDKNEGYFVSAMELQQQVLDNHAIVSISDVKGNISYVNNMFCEVSGYSRDDLIGSNHRVVKSKHHPSDFYKIMWKTIAKGDIWKGEVCNTDKEGQPYWVKTTIFPVLNEMGKPFKYVSIRTDITAQKNYESKVKRSQEQLLNLLEISPIAIRVKDNKTGKLIFANNSYSNIIGMERNQLIGASPSQFYSLESDYKAILAELSDGPVINRKLELKKGVGAFSWVLGSFYETPYGDCESACLAFFYDVTELEEAKQDAINANKAKSNFLSRMSHELRTPLNGILGFSQLLATDELAPLTPDQQENVQYISDSGNHLLTLINGLMDLSVIEAGLEKVVYEEIQLSLLVHNCIAILTPLIDSKQLRLQVDLHIHATVVVDKLKAKQVILNILSNAIKYNTEGGSIVISTEKTDNEIVLTVSDSGQSIKGEEEADLFTEFERLGMEKTKIEGTGIGLSTAKKMMHLMHGDLGYRPYLSEQGEVIGSTFWLEFGDNEIT